MMSFFAYHMHPFKSKEGLLATKIAIFYSIIILFSKIISDTAVVDMVKEFAVLSIPTYFAIWLFVYLIYNR